MVRTFAAAVVALVLAAGSAFAEEDKGTFVKFADGTLTLKVDDKDKEFKIPADLKVKVKRKGENMEVAASEMLGRLKDRKPMLTLTIEKDAVKDIKVERKKKDPS